MSIIAQPFFKLCFIVAARVLFAQSYIQVIVSQLHRLSLMRRKGGSQTRVPINQRLQGLPQSRGIKLAIDSRRTGDDIKRAARRELLRHPQRGLPLSKGIGRRRRRGGGNRLKVCGRRRRGRLRKQFVCNLCNADVIKQSGDGKRQAETRFDGMHKLCGPQRIDPVSRKRQVKINR